MYTTKEAINTWIQKHIKHINRNGIIINSDMTVTMNRRSGSWVFDHQNLTEVPFKIRRVKGNISFSNNLLKSLDFATAAITGEMLWLDNNQLTSLKGIEKINFETPESYIFAHGNNIESHVLGVLLVKNLKHVTIFEAGSKNVVVDDIINRHLKSKARDILLCQHELIEAGFPQFAKL